MLDFFSDHPVLCGILAIILVLALVIGIAYGIRGSKNILFGGNRQVFDTKYAFHWAIIELGNGEILEGAVKSWNDYDESDTVQIIMEDGIVILTHYSKVLLFSERP